MVNLLGKAKEKIKDAGRKAKVQGRKSKEYGRQMYLNADDALSKTSLKNTRLTRRGRDGPAVEEMMSTENLPKASQTPPVPALPSFPDSIQKSEKKKQGTSQVDSDSRSGDTIDKFPLPPSTKPKDQASTRSRNQSKNRARKGHGTGPTQEQLDTGSFLVDESDNPPADDSDEESSAPRPFTASDLTSIIRPSRRSTPAAAQSTDKRERKGRER